MLIEVKRKILPTNDYAFKKIFGSAGNEDITKDLLNSILLKKVKNIELDCNSILEKNIYSGKTVVLDIKARLNNESLCNIEMQIASQKHIVKRMLYYWSKLYSSEIGEGEEYRKLKKTISVLIADFELDILKDSAKCHTKWEIREAEYGKIVLTEVFELHIIELPKTVYTVKENLEENLLMWLKFIKNPEMLEEAGMVKNKLLEKAKKEYEKFNKDEYEVRLAEAREKQLKDMNSRYSDGVEDGIELGLQQAKEMIMKEKMETAKKLLEMKFDIKTIMEITELNEEQIKNI